MARGEGGDAGARTATRRRERAGLSGPATSRAAATPRARPIEPPLRTAASRVPMCRTGSETTTRCYDGSALSAGTGGQARGYASPQDVTGDSAPGVGGTSPRSRSSSRWSTPSARRARFFMGRERPATACSRRRSSTRSTCASWARGRWTARTAALLRPELPADAPGPRPVLAAPSRAEAGWSAVPLVFDERLSALRRGSRPRSPRRGAAGSRRPTSGRAAWSSCASSAGSARRRPRRCWGCHRRPSSGLPSGEGLAAAGDGWGAARVTDWPAVERLYHEAVALPSTSGGRSSRRPAPTTTSSGGRSSRSWPATTSACWTSRRWTSSPGRSRPGSRPRAARGTTGPRPWSAAVSAATRSSGSSAREGWARSTAPGHDARPRGRDQAAAARALRRLRGLVPSRARGAGPRVARPPLDRRPPRPRGSDGRRSSSWNSCRRDARRAPAPGRLPVAEALALGRQMAEGWRRRTKGVVHRDLKPGNVKVTPTGA